MVLGFIRKKKQSPPRQNSPLKVSPSLPELKIRSTSDKAMAWPENLVDVDDLQQEMQNIEPFPSPPHSLTGPSKISFSQSTNESPIPFHKPFRMPTTSDASAGSVAGTLKTATTTTHHAGSPGFPAPPLSASKAGHTIYASPPSAWGRESSYSVSGRARSIRTRKNVPPTFNIMVAGAIGTGKTSLLRLILETSDISPTATLEHRASLERFLHGPTKHTKSIKLTRVEVLDSPSERLTLTAIDTPGLNFDVGMELELESQVRDIVKFIDDLYMDSLEEEHKIIRGSKGDQHVHLLVYLIDPTAVLKSRPQTSSRKSRTTPPGSDDEYSSDDDSDSDGDSRVSLPLAQIKVLKRLANKVNILPVVAHSDSMTDSNLELVKRVVKRDLKQAGLGFGVFGSRAETLKDRSATPKARIHKASVRTPQVPPSPASPRGRSNGHANFYPKTDSEYPTPSSDSSDSDSDVDEDAEADEEGRHRSAHRVIKIRSTRSGRFSSAANNDRTKLARSRSRTRRSHANDSDEDFDLWRARQETLYLESQARLAHPKGQGLNAEDKRLSYASSRIRDHQLGMMNLYGPGNGKTGEGAIAEIEKLIPFAIVAPEQRKRPKHRNPESIATDSLEGGIGSVEGQGGDYDHEASLFTRKYRWGVIDVLDPSHCDFVPMRSAIFGSHMKALRSATKEAYERFRMEKLLVRRATRTMGDESRMKLMAEAGL
ncbi:hypothetical protein SISSUDRAFT_1044871 [Sistotremastrum suecicum HHB10207 ss-3]|uniref:Septin-type G domain-containing protein n=1 Tax=Sistotremastrum suecicum HHB10207 ss-3 TaxID=1314776 RepID=A0A166ET69_9AGAM|nr:hypothetical protein SISSUDRAFT_1044871 [Sistotremastrum suecicum HHB10207 ss-3]